MTLALPKFPFINFDPTIASVYSMNCDTPLTSPTTLDRNSLNQSLYDQEIAALEKQGFSHGLTKILTQNKDEFSLRSWVVDNSDSMRVSNGCTIVENSNSSGGFELAIQ
jgi:hypothetical protein